MQKDKKENLNNKTNENKAKNQSVNGYFTYQNRNYPYYPPRVPYYPGVMPYMQQGQNMKNFPQRPVNQTNLKNTRNQFLIVNNSIPLNKPNQLATNSPKLYMEPKVKDDKGEVYKIEDGKKFSIISLILGIVSLAFLFLDLPCGIVGLILGIKARKIEKNIFSTIGIITSIIGIIKSFIFIVLFHFIIKMFAGIFLFII